MTFKVIRDERQIELAVTTTEKVTSFRGTNFVPTHCTARIHNDTVASLMLERRDADGFGVDDPAGEHGAELNVSFGGGSLDTATDKLPNIAREALAVIDKMIR